MEEALSLLLLCAPSNRRRPFSYEHSFSRENIFLPLSQKIVLNMASSDNQIDKPQRRRHKRAELPCININTGTQSINSERASLKM